MNYCPNCGHDLKQYDDVVKQPPNSGVLATSVEADENSAVQANSLTVKESEAKSAQQSRGVTLTTVEKVQIQELIKEGYALARIRKIIGRLDVPLSAIVAASRIPK